MNEKFPLALPENTILAGQYVIVRVLGQGGFGITYEAIDHKTGQKVAVKEFFPDTMATRTQTTVTAFAGERGASFVYGKDCFLQEAETLAQFIGNENIVRVHSYFEENGTAYFVMDFVEGTSFDVYLKEHGGRVSYEEAEKILLPVMDALAAVHSKGIVHRDVTPDNIYITKDGTVKLLDFGAARYSLGDKSRSLDVVLKHGFAPKEQYTRHGKQGAFTDVYSLGATFYFAITGRRPPDSIDRLEEDDLVPPSSLGIAIPSEKEEAILKAMSVQPADRYPNMIEFMAALTKNPTPQVQPQPVQTPQPVQQRYFTQPEPVQTEASQTPPMRAQQIPYDPSMMQVGVSQTVASQVGVSQTPPMRAQQIPYDPSMMQVGVSQTVASQVGVSQVGVSQAGVSQVGVSQAGVSQVGVSQAGVSQVGVSQAGVSQVGVSQVGVSQVGVSQTVQQPVPQPEQKKSNKWILPVGIGACGVGVIAIIVAIVVAVGGKNKDTQVANYETGGGGGSSYHESTDTEKSGSLILQPDTQATEPESQTTEPETQETVTSSGRAIVGNDPNNITQGAPMVQNGGYLYLRYPGVGLVRSDGDNTIVIDSSDARCLSIVGDYLYYIDGDNRACYARTDGSTSAAYVLALQSYKVNYLWVAEDGYFFHTMDGNDVGSLNYVDSAGENVETLTGFYSNNIAFMDGYVYYVADNYYDTGAQICRVPVTNLEAKAETVYTFTDLKAANYLNDLVAADGKLYFYFSDGYTQMLAGYDVSSGDTYEYYLSDMFGEIYTGNVNVGGGYVYLGVELNDSDLTEKICRVPVQQIESGTINIETLYSTADYHGIWSVNLLPDNNYMSFGMFDSNFNEVLFGMGMDGSGDPVILGSN
jgi:serine/threonine protein kinase